MVFALVMVAALALAAAAALAWSCFRDPADETVQFATVRVYEQPRRRRRR
jgi:hypothetical protein